MGRPAVAFLIMAAIVAASAGPAGASQQPDSVTYLPPVDAELVDHFRPPEQPYGAGNRGVDYATAEGQTVLAAAAGEVVFAGRVGHGLHVVVLHDDGIRTSYSFLSTVAVRRGDRVARGEVVGAAGTEPLHLGARAGEVYVDPLVLFGQRPGRVHLVDDDDRRPLREVEERRRLVDLLRGARQWAIGAAGKVGGWAVEKVGDAVQRRIDLALALTHQFASLAIPVPVRLAVAATAWHAERATCTPQGTPVPPSAGRRIVILVGGLWSESGDTAVGAVNTRTLGYADADVHRFSYGPNGGDYGRADTEGDIDAAGRQLAAQVAALGEANPGVPIDIIGHSMGGLVGRSAITRGGATGVATLVTLATPHQGADLATATESTDGSTSGHLLLDGLALVPGLPDPAGRSVSQMAETSDYLYGLKDESWPAFTTVVSVAARGDVVVPNTRSRLPGAGNAVVTPGGTTSWDDHARLPRSPEATTEIARAISGQRPSCRSFDDLMVDELLAAGIGNAEDIVGAALAVGGFVLDAKLKAGALAQLR